MEKKLLILIAVVVIISVVSSFFAGAIVGIAPLGIAGVKYSSCPKWRCTYFKSFIKRQIIGLNSSVTFNGYTFLLLNVYSSPVNSTARIQIKGENILDTFWVKTNETHYTLGGTYGVASYTPNGTTGVSYKNYTIYVIDGENDRWAYIQIKDKTGVVVWSEIMEENHISTIHISNTTIFKVKLKDVKASTVTGEIYAKLIVGDTDIYTTLLDGHMSWAFIKISMYYPSVFYVCFFNNPGNCEPYGSCRYCFY